MKVEEVQVENPEQIDENQKSQNIEIIVKEPSSENQDPKSDKNEENEISEDQSSSEKFFTIDPKDDSVEVTPREWTLS